MKSKIIVFWLLLFGALFAFLQVYSNYHFFYIEQSQLFQFTSSYFTDRVGLPGGGALLLSQFLVQFFIVPYVGPAIVAGLLTWAGFCTARIVKRIAPLSEMFFLAFLPVATLLFVQFDFNYLVWGTVAYDCMLVALYGYLAIRNIRVRLAAGLILTPILFWIAGPISFLFAMLVSAYELLNRTPKGYWAMLMCLEVILLGIGSVYFSIIGEYRFAFLPDAYYHRNLEPKSVLYFSWISLFFVLLIAFLVKKRVSLPGTKQRIGEALVQILLICVLFWWGIPRYSDQKSAKYKELDYYARMEQWDHLIEACQGKMNNYLYMCYLNMALAEKGELADRMFAFDQRGPQGLLVPWNKTEQISCLLSNVYFAMGYIAPAQEMAFEGYVSAIGGGNPRMLKRLVQTNLIHGAYPVAEKYIRVLENTYYYRDWATSQRKFLYQDAVVASDPVLGPRRKLLPQESNLAEINGLAADLQKLAEANPSYSAPIQYLGAFYLLSKDLKSFKEMVEKNFGTEILSSLPVRYQEAIIVLSEKEPDYWKQYGISETVVERFTEYKRQIIAHKNNQSALPGLLRRAYGDTYWYYFMFK